MPKGPAVAAVGVAATVLGYLTARFVPVAGIDPNYVWVFTMAIVSLIGSAVIVIKEGEDD